VILDTNLVSNSVMSLLQHSTLEAMGAGNDGPSLVASLSLNPNLSVGTSLTFEMTAPIGHRSLWTERGNASPPFSLMAKKRIDML
jgi:hypothetical protein